MRWRFARLRGRAAGLAFAVLVTLAVGTGAWAYFSATGRATAHSAVGSVLAPSAITVGQTGSNITIGWTAAALSDGGAVQGYRVIRSDGTVECGGSTLVTTTTCTYPAAAASGSFTYTVTAVYHGFTASATSSASTILTVPTITASPPTASASTAASFAFSGGGASSYRCSLDGATYASCTSPQAYSGLAAGSHTFAVRAVSGASTGPSTTYTWTVDTAAPTISSAPANPTNSTTASFAFSGPEGSYTFQCKLDAGSFSACASPRAYSGLAAGSHTFSVRAVSSDGGTTAVATDTWLVDVTAPTSTITFPTTGSSDNNAGWAAGCATAGLCGAGADTGGAGVKQVQVSIQQGSGNYWNGTGFASATEVKQTAIGTTSWSYPFPASNFPADGAYTVRVYATDNAGNVQSTATTSTVTVDNTTPAVTLTTLNGTTTTFPTFRNSSVTTIGGACGTATGDQTTISWSVTGAATQNGSAICTAGAWTATLSPALSTAGAYTLTAAQSDQAANTGTSGAKSVTIDLTAPSSAVTFPTGGSSYSNTTWASGCSSSICGTAADTGGAGVKQVQVSIQQGTGNYWNGTSFASITEVKQTATGTTSWTLPFTAANFPAAGTYTIRAYATDNANNTQTTATTSTVTIDNTAPTVTLTKLNGTTTTFPSFRNSSVTTIGGACGTATGDQTTVSWSVSGAATQNGSATCTAGAWTATLSPALSTAGAYTLTAAQSDQAGNSGTSGAKSVTIDLTAPTSAITFPTTANTYNNAGWAAGCATAGLCGTATDTGGAGVKQVQVSIQRGSGNYWNGTSFASATEVKQTATGTTSWSLAFPAANFPAAGAYTIRAYATDNAGNTQATATTSTVTIDNAAPTITITSVNGGGLGGILSLLTINSYGGACGTATGDQATVNWSVVSGSTTVRSGTAPCTSGSWTATVSPSITALGSYTLRAGQSDAAGNTGSASQAATVI